MSCKVSTARKGTNEWKLFTYFKHNKTVSSRDSKYPPLVIMDLPKLISSLQQKGYAFDKKTVTGEDRYGNKKRWVEYTLTEEVDTFYAE